MKTAARCEQDTVLAIGKQSAQSACLGLASLNDRCICTGTPPIRQRHFASDSMILSSRWEVGLNFRIVLSVAILFAAPIALSNSDALAFAPRQMLIGDEKEGDVVSTKSADALRRKDRRTLVQRQLYDAFILYANEQNESALAIVETVIAEFESNRKHTDKIYYCARDRSEKAALAKLAAKNRQHAEIGGSEWCDALFHKAVLMSEFKQFDEADRAFAQSVDMAPFNMGGLRKYALWLQSRGQWQRSIDVFRSAISLNEHIPRKSRANFPARAYRGIGFGLIALGRLDEAEASYRESLKYDPDDSLVPRELEYIKMLRENRVPIDHMRAIEF